MRTRLIPLIVAAVVVVLQIVVAPVIPIWSVYPNFIIPFVLVLAIVRKPDSTYLYAFVLGLLSDLFSNTPLGLTPLLLLIASFVLSRAFEALDKTTMAMPLITLLATLFVMELVTVCVMAGLGYGSFLDLFIQRALPLTVYNAVIGLIYYLLVDKLSLGQSSDNAWTISDDHRYR